MTATEELRRMLDERGVEWTKPKSALENDETDWERGEWEFCAIEGADDELDLTAAYHEWCTPAQAIEATLGRERTCTNGVKPGRGVMPRLYCSNCGCYTTLNKPDNATSYSESFMDWPFYCGNCGAKVVGA